MKIIAYRAETAMASIVREALARTDDSRSLLRDLFRSEADLLPDVEHRLLRVHVFIRCRIRVPTEQSLIC